MWLMTRHGFFSVTTSPVEKGRMQIRARSKHDLLNLDAVHGIGAKIIETPPPADYRWRMVVSRETLEAIVLAEVRQIDYGNFKSAVHDTPGQEDKGGPYMRCWTALLAIQTGSDHTTPGSPDIFMLDTFTTGGEPDELHPYPEGEAPQWVYDPCTCGHRRGDHLHAEGHCTAPAKVVVGQVGHCPCEGFKMAAAVDPLHNPKAQPKLLRSSRVLLDQQRPKGGKQ